MIHLSMEEQLLRDAQRNRAPHPTRNQAATPPMEPVAVASWLPVKPDLTLHGLRHGHQTWLDDLGIRYVLQSERMGHEVPGMRGIYSHVTPAMRKELTDTQAIRRPGRIPDRAL